MSRIISIFSGKGGVGKTTIASNLAAALSSKFNKSVILVDCNITTSHLGMHLGLYEHPVNLNHVLRGEADVNDAIYKHLDNMKIVPASLSLRDMNGVDVSRLKSVIDRLDGKADFILLDTAPGLGREAVSVLNASKEVLFVSRLFMPSVSDLIKCREAVKDLGTIPLGIVLNMSTGRDELNKSDIEDLMDLPVIGNIPQNKNISKSLVAKKPVVVYNPNCSVSKEFYKIAGKITGEYRKFGILDKFRNVF